ncbi:nucleotidyltransferase family protein [Sedimentitalea todarodis]|uniref:Nucleotidyltransferase family protein n=1 Tax=Sedimentitalea todarodis TaxID=1631240 RepID=A0ABU3VIM5_9RHOB|nr:nucleotidyltransferase family protein [Sedimentitalea todarodis]MDU9006038.1 nucleotidyltransferase family protein [Sedimentitalea todarodis]
MKQSPDAVMLFAAGFGTRMAPLTDHCPKPLIPVAGKPLIDHALALIKATNPARIVANTHYLPDQMADHLRPLGVSLSPEQPEILDTGGGLRAALPQLGNGPVFTLNPDAIWAGPNPLTLLRKAWKPDQMDGLLVCVPIAQTVGRIGSGDFDVNESGRISRGADFVYGGAQIVKTDELHDIPENSFSLNVLWDRMLQDGKLFALRYPGRWCDIGHPAGIGLAEDLLAQSDV